MQLGVRRRPKGSVCIIAAVAIIATASSACGSDEVRSDGDAPPTTMSMGQWVRSMDRVCVDLDEQFGELAEAELRNAADATEHAEAVEDYAGQLQSAAARLAAASVDRSAIASFETVTVRLSEAASELLRATRDDGAAASAAVASMGVAIDAINELAAELSLDGCDGF